MINAFNTAVSALQGFFSKLFWFGVFVPVALFAALHLGIAALTYSEFRKRVESVGEQDVWLVGPILGLIVLAFLLSPLLPLLRGLLDGSLLPRWLRSHLVARRTPAVQSRRNELRQARDAAGATQRARRGYESRVPAAYRQGEALPAANSQPVVKAARARLTAIQDALKVSRPPSPEELEAAIQAVVLAQTTNNPNIVALEKLRGARLATEEAQRVRETSDVGDELETLLRDAQREADGQYDAAVLRLRGNPVEGAVQPTPMGDARRAAERYSTQVYGVDFTFLWPRLLTHVPSTNSPVADRLTTAQAALDAAVMGVFLSASLLAWLPVLAWQGTDVAVFLAVALGAPLLVAAFHGLAVEAQFGIGEAYALAIDRHRFDVLVELRQPIPTSRGAERALWARIVAAANHHQLAELPYALPPERQG